VGLRGPKPRSVEEHIARGSYRRSRHGPKPERSLEATDPYTDDWIKEAWRLLRLPGGPPRPLSLDPIAELLEREGIEVTDEDRKPKSPAATSDAREADTKGRATVRGPIGGVLHWRDGRASAGRSGRRQNCYREKLCYYF
jgi:hypothetical protein